jgi:beta-fructofuranosidase
MFYTGNHRDENWVRTPYTCAAILGPDGQPKKLPEPLFGPRDDYSEHQRDPKVIYVPEKNKYFIFIGAQTLDKKGTALIYESDKLLEGWKFAGQLNVPGFEDFGGMWECPCIVNISGKDVLIFSPQYTKLPGRAESTNHNVYIVGKMDYDTLTFTPESGYQYLDFGFDFYAAQFAANVGDPEKAILVGWIGLPDNHYCTEPEEWEGSMSLMREVRLCGDRLIQNPIPEITSLRDEEIAAEGKLPAFCEVEANFTGGDADFNLFTKADGTGGVTLHYDAAAKVITVCKSGMNKRFNENVGETLDMPLTSDLRKLRIMIDRCSFEIFANDGEETFTAHIYPEADEHNYTITDNGSVKIWTLKPSVEDNFIV